MNDDIRESIEYFRNSEAVSTPILHGRTLDAEIARLNAVVHQPHTDEFWSAASIEAEYQRQTRASEDGDKTPAAWFWLIGYLGGKALHAFVSGDIEKAKHHVITTAAACANWFLAITGQDHRMQPGTSHPLGTERKLPALKETGISDD